MTDDDLNQIESNAMDGWYPCLRVDVLSLVNEVRRLRQQIEGHCARIAAQSELLSRRAEKKVEPCPVALARLADDGCPHEGEQCPTP